MFRYCLYIRNLSDFVVNCIRILEVTVCDATLVYIRVAVTGENGERDEGESTGNAWIWTRECIRV